ncbi:putative F-box protein At2g33190 [Lolium perenne]|uniref:putative F-box protein At2g33190 n=1 Tax=Lolium perenne TaxID=4522 RepID=UPI003A99B858
MDPTVPPAAVVHGQHTAEPSPPALLRSVCERPHPIRSCRRPLVCALPSTIPRGGLGEAYRVQLGLVAEKFLLSANTIEKLESFPELIRLLLQHAPGNQILGISFRYPDLLHLVGLEAGQPRSVIYKLSHHRALLDMLFSNYFSRSSSSSSTDYTPMEAAPSVPRIMALHVHPTDLCSLVSRVVPKLLGQSPSLLNNKTLLIEPIAPELPVDILMHVFATLEIPDLVRAGSVCTSWFSAYATLRKLGKHKQSQTPCLLYTSESAGENVACLYSLVEKRVYKLNLPEPAIRSRFLIGSSLGLLVTVDDRSEMHLVNPITGEQIALPSVTTMKHVKPICNDSGAVHKYEYTRDSAKQAFSTSIYALCALRESFYFKSLVFYDDTSSGRFIVVLIHEPFGQLSFARVGDDKWTWLPPHDDYQDCTYKDGLLYAVTKRAEIHAFDLSGPAVTMEIIRGVDVDLDLDCVYIVQAPWGGLLLVSRLIEIEDPDDEEADTEIPLPKYTVEIKLYKVDVGTMKLVETDCLPGYVLFLGHNHSLCLSAKEYPSLKGNHAYFTDDDEYITGRKSCRRDIGVVDLGSNSKKDLVPPQLWSNWPAPVWITPNITMMKLVSNK